LGRFENAINQGFFEYKTGEALEDIGLRKNDGSKTFAIVLNRDCFFI